MRRSYVHKWMVFGVLGVAALSALVSLPSITGEVSAEMLINGAGATFPYPLYSKWFSEYAKVDPSARFNYQSIGSGGGIRQVKAGTVDFGASDAVLSDEDLKQMPRELLHIPTVAGAVVITYNLPGVGKGLKLTPDALAEVYLGQVTRWNDAKIASLNPNMNVPAQQILVVHRSDGSGTTNIFTTYLNAISNTWATKVGKGTSVNWPVGLGGKGNEGVAGQVKQTPGAIGYVELAYAEQNKLPYALLKNRAGRFVEPSLEATSAAVAGAIGELVKDVRVPIVNSPAERAYPIAGLTYLLVYKAQDDQKKAASLAKFFWWAIHDGQKYAPELLYAPLPPQVVKVIESTIKQITFQGKPVLAAN
jgi:phosphate transport system substrate-binding protein